ISNHNSGGGGDAGLHQKIVGKLSSKESGLHSVSSSPDFLNSETLESDQRRQNQKSKYCDLDQRLGQRDEETVLGAYSASHKSKHKKLFNVRILKPPTSSSTNSSGNGQQSGKSPSMRVIIQSK